MTPTAWTAGPDEAEHVAGLLVAFRDHNGHDWPSDNAFLASVEKLMDRRDTDFLLGASSEDSPPQGVCQLRFRFSVWTATDDCWLEDLYVAPTARRSGVGAALVEAALERARERGCRRIELDTSESNAAAIALYERYGFSTSSKSGSETRDLFLGRSL
jgi:ribosomal protein S18 acetylase RimI-like enzyme